jgi:hypothetical protein
MDFFKKITSKKKKFDLKIKLKHFTFPIKIKQKKITFKVILTRGFQNKLIF